MHLLDCYLMEETLVKPILIPYSHRGLITTTVIITTVSILICIAKAKKLHGYIFLCRAKLRRAFV